MRLIRAGRDLRVDFFRGLALWWIFLDHIPDDWLNQLSLRNYALCDSAEVFVLLAGYGAGLAYGKSMDRSGWLFAAADTLKRAWTLYIAHIFLFVVFSAQVSTSAILLNRADYLDEMDLDVVGEQPYRAMLEALTLHFQPAYLNILPMYIALLVLFAAVMPLLRRPLILGAASLALYAVARLFDLNLSSWTGDGWYFNPLTWQLLFIAGAILAYAPGSMPKRSRLFDVLAAIVVVFGLVMQWAVLDHPEITEHLPLRLARALLSIDKTGLHPLRLLSIIALTWSVARLVPPGARWIGSRWAAPFVLCGQHSLAVFCSGIALSFLGRLVMEETDGWWLQIVVNVAGAAALVGIGALAAWYKEKGRPAPRPLAGGVTP